MLDTAREAARLFAPKPKTASTKHVHDANEAFEELGDAEEYRPRYLAIYKKAAKAFVSLDNLKEKAKGKQYPGRWFLQSARIVLGITKKTNQ